MDKYGLEQSIWRKVLQKGLLPAFIFAISILICGCGQPAMGPGNANCGFVADDVDIIGLTSVEQSSEKPNTSTISVYAALLDAFDSSFKFPATFRFELYQFVPRSSQPKGKRIIIWDDYDLNYAAANNRYWNDFLRAYHFELDLKSDLLEKGTYVLQVTCLTAESRRLTDIFELDY